MMKLDDFLLPGKQLFAFNLKFLYYTGLWPEDDWPKIRILMYTIYDIVLHVIPIIYLIITGIGTYENRKDIITMVTNIDKSLVAYNFVLKIFFFSLKRRQIRILVTEIIHSGDCVSKERQRLMAISIIIVTILSSATVGAFSIFTQLNGELPIEAWLPFDKNKNKLNLFLGLQSLAPTFMVCLLRNFAIQGIVCSVVMYLCDNLVDVQDMVKNMKFSKETEALVRRKFKEIIKKHVRLMRYSRSFTKIFQEYFLIQNQAFTLQLCLNAIIITVVGLADKLLFASFCAYMSLNIIDSYIFNFLGNELIIHSEGIALAAYNSEWTSWPIDMQKDLLIVIRVAQRPLSLTAGGMSTMCIRTFSQALYNAYSIFAVLSDMVQ